MCGIAGIVAKPNDIRRAALRKMVQSIRHRGPDGIGYKEHPNCLLGHARLAIVDIEHGAQPMSFTCGSVDISVTFNGELYGYKQLRDELRDFPFTTQSDTELLLAEYVRSGRRMAKNIPGMFSFAIWDEKIRQLHCVRDRFGEKPFFYATGVNGEFVFASEVQAIVASGLVETTIDRLSLSHYLQRMYVPTDRTIYSEIKPLPPAHSLTYTKSSISIEPYWTLPKPGPDMSLHDAAAELKRLLTKSVESQLVADVPVGVFLSGGLDSTTIASIASKQSPHIHSYSFDFPGALSERSYAESAAQFLGTNHTLMSAATVNIADALCAVTAAYGEPFGDSSAIPTYMLCRSVSQHTKVVLTGDGGDELFGGYSWYKPLFWMDSYSDTTAAFRLGLRIRSRIARTFHTRSATEAEQKNIGAIYRSSFDSIASAHSSQLCIIADGTIRELGLPIYDKRLDGYEDSLDSALRIDIQDYMPGDILTKIDRASMAHGVELRAPFLDIDTAEFCMSLASSLKINQHSDKLVLRSAYSSQWPDNIRNRSKQGFGAPVSTWLTDDGIREMIEQLLTNKSSQLYDFVDYSLVRQLLASPGPLVTWNILCLANWLQMSNGHGLTQQH